MIVVLVKPLFLYAEHFAQKGPNEVLLCLDHYLSHLEANVKQLHIFADNAFDRNKNRYVLVYIQHFQNITEEDDSQPHSLWR